MTSLFDQPYQDGLGEIDTELKGHIFFIKINRPEKYNGFSWQMMKKLAEAYTEFENTEAARVAVLHAEGKHFTAGMDLANFEMTGHIFPPGYVDPAMLREPYRTKPLVVAVHGYCYTIGIELALAADVVIADPETKFTQLEVKRGIMANAGATIRMTQRAGWGNAMKILLTGELFGAEDALRYNFIQEISAPGKALERAIQIAEEIAKNSPVAIGLTLANARTAVEHGQQAAVAQFVRITNVQNASEDYKEGVQSFLERREANFPGR